MKANKYQIIVSDPWDFERPDGVNIIIGGIIKEMLPDFVIFKCDSQLQFNNMKSSYLLLKPRYSGDNIKEKNEYHGVVNGGLIMETTFNNIPPKVLESTSKFVLIGTLRKL